MNDDTYRSEKNRWPGFAASTAIILLLMYVAWMHSAWFAERRTWEQRAIEALYARNERIALEFEERINDNLEESKSKWHEWVRKTTDEWRMLLQERINLDDQFRWIALFDES